MVGLVGLPGDHHVTLRLPVAWVILPDPARWLCGSRFEMLTFIQNIFDCSFAEENKNYITTVYLSHLISPSMIIINSDLKGIRSSLRRQRSFRFPEAQQSATERGSQELLPAQRRTGRLCSCLYSWHTHSDRRSADVTPGSRITA